MWRGAAHGRDAECIADMGANCVRLAHYQQSEEMYDACDRHRLVVWAEIPYFAQSWDDDAHKAAVKSIDRKRITVVAHESGADWDHKLHEISDTEGWNHPLF